MFSCEFAKFLRTFFYRTHMVASADNHQIFFTNIRPEACNFIKKETLAQLFSFEFCEMFINNFFQNTSGWLLLINPFSVNFPIYFNALQYCIEINGGIGKKWVNIKRKLNWSRNLGTMDVCNPGQNIWNKLKKSSKTGQEKKSLVSTFASFLTAIAKV